MEKKSSVVIVAVLVAVVSCFLTFAITKSTLKDSDKKTDSNTVQNNKTQSYTIQDVEKFEISKKFDKEVTTEISLNGKKHIITEGYYVGESVWEGFDLEEVDVLPSDKDLKKVFKDIYFDNKEIITKLSAGTVGTSLDETIENDKKYNENSIKFIKDVENQAEYLFIFNRASAAGPGDVPINNVAYLFKDDGSKIDEYTNKVFQQDIKVIENDRFSQNNVEVHAYKFYVLKSFDCDKNGNVSAYGYEIRNGEVKEIDKITYKESELDIAGASC